MERESRSFPGILSGGAFFGALFFGMVSFTFPLIPLEGADHMTLVPLAGRFAFSGLLIPLCAVLCVLRCRRGPVSLFKDLAPRLSRPLAWGGVALLGPLALMPVLTRSAAHLTAVLAGRPASAAVQTAISCMLLLAASILASGPGSGLRAPRYTAVALIALFASAAALCSLFSAAPESALPQAGGGWEHLENYVVLPLSVAFLLHTEESPGPPDVRPYRHPLFGSACAGGILAAAMMAAALLCLRHTQIVPGSSLAETLACCMTGGLARVSALAAVLFLSATLLAMCLRACSRQLMALTGQEERAGNTFFPYALALPALILALPGIGGVYQKIASSMLVASYPVFAVAVLFYALIPQPDTPRKRTSARYALIGTSLFSVVMFVYQIAIRFDCGHPLFTGLYESMLLSRAHLTWLPLAAVCFVLGDTNHRKKEEREKEKEQKLRRV